MNCKLFRTTFCNKIKLFKTTFCKNYENLQQSRKVDTKNIYFNFTFSKVDMRNIFTEVVFSKVDTDNNFCRNPFSKVDTMIRSLVMSLFARDSSFGQSRETKSKVDTAQSYFSVSFRFCTNLGSSVRMRFEKVSFFSSSPRQKRLQQLSGVSQPIAKQGRCRL